MSKPDPPPIPSVYNGKSAQEWYDLYVAEVLKNNQKGYNTIQPSDITLVLKDIEVTNDVAEKVNKLRMRSFILTQVFWDDGKLRVKFEPGP